MSDSKKDLTRIEDLGEYLHQLDDDEDYLPDLPDESEPPPMEETLITDNPLSFENENSSGFESDISDFNSDSAFESENSFEGTNDFSSSDTFETENSFETEAFSEDPSFESESAFENDSPFTNESSFEEDSAFPDINGPEVSATENENFSNDDYSADTSSFASTPLDENSSVFNPIEDAVPLEDPLLPEENTLPVSPVMEKTPFPTPEVTEAYKAPENFEDLKKFAENSSFTGMASEGNPSFSVLIKDIKYIEDAEDILLLLKELGLAMDSDEVLNKRLSRGEFLVPRISEFAATLLAHKLRRFDVDILVGLTDEIQPPKNGQEPEVGLVSKHSLYQNQSHHFQFGDFNLDISQIVVSATPTLDGHQVVKYLGVATEHKMLDGQLVEDENSLEISSHYQELAQKLKAHALKGHANAVVGINYQLTPLPSSFGSSYTRYRLTCTGNLVWINKL